MSCTDRGAASSVARRLPIAGSPAGPARTPRPAPRQAPLRTPAARQQRRGVCRPPALLGHERAAAAAERGAGRAGPGRGSSRCRRIASCPRGGGRRPRKTEQRARSPAASPAQASPRAGNRTGGGDTRRSWRRTTAGKPCTAKPPPRDHVLQRVPARRARSLSCPRRLSMATFMGHRI